MEHAFSPDIHAKILIVDDDPMMRLLMRESLENETYAIEEVDNGLAALEHIRKNPPDMVLLDVKMPGLSGFDVCAQIREKYDTNSISIVVVTGLDDSESIEHAFNLGATAFINKPINPVTFPYRIQYLLSARNAFIELKQREIHLEHMDRISRILTHGSDLELILQETLQEMRNIFQADRIFILRADDTHAYDMTLVCESVSEPRFSLQNRVDRLVEQISHNVFYRARNSEYPILSLLPQSQALASAQAEFSIEQQMLKAMHLHNNQTWYIVLHLCQNSQPWTALQQETFYRITIRLGTILNHHLLLQDLHENEALLRQAQHIGKLGNWTLNFKTGELYWSDEIYRIYGYEPGSFTPTLHNLREFVLPEDKDRLLQFEQNAFLSGTTESIEYRIKLPDHQVRWIHKQGIGKFDENGQLVSVNGTLQDITERILKQEQELHEHKMDAVGQLTSGVAHDFGNLMTIAKGNLELLDDTFMARYQIDEDDQEIIEDARSAICDGVELTKQLLAFSRKKSIAPEHLDISSAITNFDHLFKKTLGDTISLTIKIQPHLPTILVDSTQFESCLLNAVINARDAMPRGGHLRIHVKKLAQLPKSLSLQARQPFAESYICINISDTGEGMNEDTLKRATEPFFTTKGHDGTGLGLSMIYGFMRQSNGALNIESKPGKGTCIIMYFPVYERVTSIDETRQASTVDSIAGASPEQTILVVEDREAVRRFAVRCLRQLPCKILQAEDASDAIDVLNSNADVSLLFSDILMPGDMNGRELARWVQQNRPEIKILLTTASERERESEQHAASPQQPFQILPKPYSQHDLLTKINEIL